ncbi:hypothetical protein N7532_000428 [Penicillium argentinense]|uniref:UDP-glucoronosyl and UDP-glucosyl transferase n=1 Tax=Penicillium argentinense TaxID=1131581 RepID=A0A9W9G5N0_9EURO|nr:uncharacterized protein N7532_000428 [Penicillium argentinense]KAJ5112383.1 hypothetical protein N7532_000428 [Penicillium argentinense]
MSHVHPPRKILLVATTGGFTHAAPVLELGRVLADRGHYIEFATLDSQESWIQPDYGFIAKVHLLGPGPTAEQLDAHYRRMQAWDVRKGIEPTLVSKAMFDTFWPQTYRGLNRIMNDPVTRPDMIIADFFAEAANDILVEYRLPIAIVCPNWPPLQLPCSYIPGQPGFQLPGTLTSENASMWLRLKNELVILFGLPAIMRLFKQTRAMRREHGVFYPLHKPKKPDYLLFVNSFVGLEIPRDLPPSCAPVGPLLCPTWAPLDTECDAFLNSHDSVLYIALGTHIILPHEDVIRIMNGAIHLMEEGLIDGVIWAIPKTGRADIDGSETVQMKINSKEDEMSLNNLLANKHRNWLFHFFAPQRAILAHDSTKLYFTHGGGSSANEALYHGKPMLSMGIFFDQTANTTRLVAGGVAESLDKFHFTSDEIYTKARKILESGENWSYARNVLRLQRIAHVAARRKFYAADLVEEVIYDHELRFDKDGRELRPMHLQTADSRMAVWKVNNWDLYAVSAVGLVAVLGSMGVAGRYLWSSREPLRSFLIHGWSALDIAA